MQRAAKGCVLGKREQVQRSPLCVSGFIFGAIVVVCDCTRKLERGLWL